MNDRSNFDNNQPPEIAQLDMDFKKEISIDEDGIPVLSRRAVARLSGVNVSSIYKNLKSLADARSGSPALIAFNGQDFQGDAPLPDTLAFALITHYAFCAQRTTEEARRNATLLGGVKFREWCYKIKGKEIPGQEKTPPVKTKILLERLVNSLENSDKREHELIAQGDNIMFQISQVVQQRDKLIEQQQISKKEKLKLIELVGEIHEQEQILIDIEMNAKRRRAEIKVLPKVEKQPKQYLAKREYDVANENIPLQHLALTFNHFRSDNNRALGRNRLYEIFRVEGISWEHNNEIDIEFYRRGYFVMNEIELPSGNVSKMTFCTPKGWAWLKDLFKTDWAKYII